MYGEYKHAARFKTSASDGLLRATPLDMAFWRAITEKSSTYPGTRSARYNKKNKQKESKSIVDDLIYSSILTAQARNAAAG